MLGKLVDIVLKNYTKQPSLKEVLEIVKKNDFWKRSKPEAILAKVDIPEFWDYIKAQYKAKIKSLITTSQLELSKSLASTLETHPHSSFLFSDLYERVNQYKFNLTYKNIKFRGIIDMVLIDHEYKTVRLIDLKTGQGPSAEFISSFLRYRYYFQEAVYMKAFDIICKDLGLTDYKLLPFQFLYIGRTEKIPILFEISQKWHDAAIAGFTSTGGYQYKGLDETLEEIVWHFKNKEFTLPRNISENNGSINLNDNFFNVE